MRASRSGVLLLIALELLALLPVALCEALAAAWRHLRDFPAAVRDAWDRSEWP
jgi:hypothetical protein